MVVSAKQNTHKSQVYQGNGESACSSAKINAFTSHGLCDTRITAFGGLFPLIKFLKIVEFEQIVSQHYTSPRRKTQLGCYKMLTGFIMLIFIGFQRINHFDYIRTESLICGFLRQPKLPAVSTFWRYLASLTYNQARSILRISGIIRQRVWEQFDKTFERIHVNIDTTVATVYGNTEGARKGHNSRHRGKKGLRPVLLFIEETREYLCGTQRRGETMNSNEVAKQINQIAPLLPDTVKEVIVRGDGEFIGWESVKACMHNGFHYIFGNKRCDPPFPVDGWYRKGHYEYNEVTYQPLGWEKACRFVAMRIPKEHKGERQLELFKDDEYLYRIFVTDLKNRSHKVIKNYDKRADVENCIEEAQKEGILSIPSKRFLSNMVFFQIVMLAYNFWRWIKIAAQVHSETERTQKRTIDKPGDSSQYRQLDITNASLRISRLKMLYLSAKIVMHGNVTTIKYSTFDPRSYSLVDFLDFLDARLSKQFRPQVSRRE
jgi:hypothetical protein